MRIAVGDIHGELEKLKNLLITIEKSGDCDEYIFIGDYIDKGRHSYEVVDYLINFSADHNCRFLIGNHEYVWLKYLYDREYFRKDFLLKHGSISFASSYLKKDIDNTEFEEILDEPDILMDEIPENHLIFLKNLLPYYTPKNSQYFCVHAGVDPDCELKGICGHPLEKYLFVRKKFIYSNRLFFDKVVIFGHTACKYPYIDPYKIGIDTGATYDNYGLLTGYDLDSKIFIQDNGEMFSKEEILQKNRILNPFDEVF